ncbi:MAG: hypothetical protein ACW976_04045 [Candidatus Ranarchaeia archaeon]|jgi:hypothetical protein
MNSRSLTDSTIPEEADRPEITKMIQLLRKIVGALRKLYALASSPLTTSRDFASTYQAFVEARDIFWSAESVFARNLKIHRRFRPLMKTISSPLVKTSILCESEIAGIHRPLNISPHIEESIDTVRGSLTYLESSLN